MSARALFVVSLLLGCRPPAVTSDDGELRLEPDSLDFGQVVVGRTATLQGRLVNTSKGTRHLELGSSSTRFSVASVLDLPGGEELALEVRFTPTEAGRAEGVIEAREGGLTRALTVTGEGRLAPTCPTSTITCRALVPNDDGECLDAAQPDGTACATACIEGGTCQRGVCVGAARSCDDDDACTADRCSNDKGCLHEPVSCPGSDVCHAPTCDPTTGCGVSEVSDGTRCGENDCTTARVCIAGTCRTVSAPDGSECAAATVCHGPGVCRSGACALPASTALAPVWSVQAATTANLVFPGVADRQGNVYWLTNATSGTLVSVDRDGHPRFSVSFQGFSIPGSASGVDESPLFLISDDLLGLVVTGSSVNDGNHLEVRSTQTGALVYEKGRADFAGAFQLASATRFWVMSAGTVGVPSRLWLEARTNAGGAAWRSWLVGLDPPSGAVLWTVPGTYFEQVLADDTGLYVHEALFSQTLWAIDANGQPRWEQHPTESTRLSSTSGAALLTVYPARLRDPSTGRGTGIDAGVAVTPATLFSGDQLVTVDTNSFCRGWMAAIDVRTATVLVPWQTPPLLARCLSEPLLTSRQSLLVGIASPAEVLEVGLDGSTFFQCPLSEDAVGPAVLHRNRWIVSDGRGWVNAYDLPVPGPATRGWISYQGSFSRARRPEQ